MVGPRSRNKVGATLIELVVAIFFILSLAVVLTVSFRSAALNRSVQSLGQAQFLAQGEMETIKKAPFSSLTNRTNAHFLGVAYNLGSSQVVADGNDRVYSLTPASSSINNISGLAFIPGSTYQDFTFETKIKVLSDSPSGWQAGFVFRYSDYNNHYRFIFNATSIKLEKLVGGTTTNLYTQNQTFNLNNWYQLKVVTSGTSLSLYLNNNLLSTISDSDFSQGAIGLAILNSARGYFDDVEVTTASTTTWNFDDDPPGETATGWERFGINDLPGGQDQLTIEDYGGYTDLKKITVRVSWLQNQKTRTVQLVTLVGQYGFNQ